MTEPKNKYDKLLTDFNNRKDAISIEDLKSFTEKMLESASLNEEAHKFADKALHERVSELVSERNKRFSNDHKVQELEKLTGLTIGDIVSKVKCGTFGIIEHNQRVKDLPKMMDVFIGHYEANHMNGHTSREYLLERIVQDWAAGLLDKYRAESDWIDRNFCKFQDAVRYGYEVEKEPKYYVKLPIVVWDEFESELKDESVYLKYDITSDETRFSETMDSYKDFKAKLTEGTIKHIDERYWPFAVPVEKEAAE